MTTPMRWIRSAPEVATARVTGGLIGLLYLLGGVAVLAVALLPPVREAHRCWSSDRWRC